MTIKGFGDIIKRYGQSCLRNIPMSDFTGQGIAIDMGIVLHTRGNSTYSAHVDRTNVIVDIVDIEKVKDECFRDIFYFFKRFTQYGIEPVLVFDGQAPILKQENVRVLRKVKREKDAQKLKDLELKIAEYDILTISDDLMREKRKLMKYNAPYFGEWEDDLYEACVNGGFLTARCTEESERLCAALVRDGYCKAAYTTDYDVLVHGCHTMIKEINYQSHEGLSVEVFSCIILPEFLKQNKMTYAMLVEFGILSGCDYNIKVHGEYCKGIGAIKAWDFIQKHIKIESLPSVKPWGALNARECRGIFYPLDSSTLIRTSNFTLDKGKLKWIPHNEKTYINVRYISRIKEMLSSIDLSSGTIDEIMRILSYMDSKIILEGISSHEPYDPLNWNFKGETLKISSSLFRKLRGQPDKEDVKVVDSPKNTYPKIKISKNLLTQLKEIDPYHTKKGRPSRVVPLQKKISHF